MSNQTLQLSKLWDTILSHIKEGMNEPKLFDAFLGSSYLHNVDGDQFIVVVNSALAVKILTDKYLDFINGVVREVTQSNYEIKFIVESEVNNFKAVKNEEPELFKDLHLNPNQTFDNFVVGTSNREAQQASITVAANPGKLYNPLFIYAQSGLGKTHLLNAIGNYIRENVPVNSRERKVLYLPADDFFEEYLKFARGEMEGENLRTFFKKNVDILLIDDIQFLCGRNRSAESFFQVFSSMINEGKQVIVVSDKSPDELKGLDARLITRFNAGLTVTLKNPDYETAVQILKSKINSTELDISFFDEDVIIFVAERFSNNVRSLEGALNRLIFFANLKQAKKVTLDIAMEALQNDLNIKDEKAKLSETRIINTVADYYNLSVAQLTGKTRTNQVALPRHIAMYLIRTLLDVSFTKIGQVFGGKDHSTVMSGVEKVEKQLKNDESLQTAISDLEKRLKN